MRGMNLEEYNGEERGNKIRKILSQRSTGENNPRFGSRTPEKSIRRSICGTFKGKSFRSTYELGFLIERDLAGMLSSIEAEPFSIAYEIIRDDARIVRSYWPDFVCWQSRTIYEIKPKKFQLLNEANFDLKCNAAREYALENGFMFSVIDESTIDTALPRSRRTRSFLRTMSDVILHE